MADEFQTVGVASGRFSRLNGLFHSIHENCSAIAWHLFRLLWAFGHWLLQ